MAFVWHDEPPKPKKAAKKAAPAKKPSPKVTGSPDDVLTAVDMLIDTVIAKVQPHSGDDYDDILRDVILNSMHSGGPAGEVQAMVGDANYRTLSEAFKVANKGTAKRAWLTMKRKVDAIAVDDLPESAVITMPAMVMVEVRRLADAIATEEYSSTLLQAVLTGMVTHAGAEEYLEDVLEDNYLKVLSNVALSNGNTLSLRKWREMGEEMYFLADHLMRRL